MTEEKIFPEDMQPQGKEPFTFLCHPGVSCFTVCCKKVDLDLYPYDIIRLRKSLDMDSELFMRSHTELKRGGNPYFPTVKLKLVQSGDEQVCPFLDESGCRVYDDRPSSCRTYPLERAVDRSPKKGVLSDFYFLTNHSYCLGHQESHTYTVKQWVRNQRLDEFNVMNDQWAEIDTLFATNPWKGEGSGGPNQQLAFMVCYDIDGFRDFTGKNKVLDQFVLSREQKKRIVDSDENLLKFGFEWLKTILGGVSSLRRR
jgi:Fe-S-cluster containining protein